MLTKKQKELLDYITVVNKKFGISPSYDEMKDKLKLSLNLASIESSQH